MRKTIRRLAAWACCLCMAAGAVTAAWAQETDYAQMERELVEAQRQQLTGGEPLLTRQDVLPAGQSSVADWYAIAMARCGIGEDYETYLAALKTYVESAYAESGGLSANKATEWHRVALAVTALGGDAAAFGTKPDGTTIDLIADGCYDCVVEGGPGAQGLNGWIFALLALDAGGYQVPEGARYTRETIIEAIVSAQGEDAYRAAASGFSGVCSVTIYHYSSSAAEEPVGSPKTGDMGAPAYCAMCAASGAGTAALWLRRRGKRG